MSAPTPSPIPKPIPGAHARAAAANIAGSPAGRAAGSPAGASYRRPSTNGHSVGADDNNWRSRDKEGTSLPKGRGPERTVGGFEKHEVRAAGGGTSALSTSKGKGEVKSAALSHVPCRFFKAGACTAGSSCPFSHEVGGKKEVCQWFLKGECKFGHKCALAHIRPGEPMSMDRRNKKEQQREARERADRDRAEGGTSYKEARSLGDDLGTSPVTSTGGRAVPTSNSHPVPIKSAISASLQSGSAQSPGRLASSPLREPYGPPAAVVAGSPSAGFNQARSISGVAGFASSPSRPSPLSTSFNARGTTFVAGSLKSTAAIAHSPLRPPPPSGAFSSSFSHSNLGGDKPGTPLSASFAGGRSIWTRSETPDEPLSPRRRPVPPPTTTVQDDEGVFDADDDHGEDLLPSSLSDLLTPTERARRMSRHDSRDGAIVGSPSRAPFANPHQYVGAERLAQSAGAAIHSGGFLQALWSQDGKDARTTTGESKPSSSGTGTLQNDLGFSPGSGQGQGQQASAGGSQRSLLSQQRSPDKRSPSSASISPAVDAPYLVRDLVTDPNSPSARALQEHAPGQSLPGGLAAALSRMHMQPGRATSGLATPSSKDSSATTPPGYSAPLSTAAARRDDADDEGLFHMDG